MRTYASKRPTPDASPVRRFLFLQRLSAALDVGFLLSRGCPPPPTLSSCPAAAVRRLRRRAPVFQRLSAVYFYDDSFLVPAAIMHRLLRLRLPDLPRLFATYLCSVFEVQININKVFRNKAVASHCALKSRTMRSYLRAKNGSRIAYRESVTTDARGAVERVSSAVCIEFE
ncbi:uncharacterized protein LOC116841212 [Odontomachus brunneus]|uniref:uncharacterized protein LOC116841212 n=1 Tax=Odontomachus brunneus TaxID=486640 RepID=UPI0013F2394D|nr:uncharacterized protein LOC116841212 [Odontomachus brunneus]